ncbi:hypothetical protein AMTR_s00048p00223500 [Amborella trichopoda]|uniref:Uncharacterized protein n=1 Tax=Amborella trichopoda TaxID=13333 RepID=U5D2Q6_AMBTC|nr:hypothetical protein AMTR_s00048p00223500 [Amborella trichopoda]
MAVFGTSSWFVFLTCPPMVWVDYEIKEKTDACYADIESGLWGWNCKSSMIAKENCVLRCLSPDCYEFIYAGDPLEEGEIDYVRSQEYKYCMHKLSMGESLEGECISNHHANMFLINGQFQNVAVMVMKKRFLLKVEAGNAVPFFNGWVHCSELEGKTQAVGLGRDLSQAFSFQYAGVNYHLNYGSSITIVQYESLGCQQRRQRAPAIRKLAPAVDLLEPGHSSG